MKKQIYDEKNGLSYTLHGDYYLLDLEINEEEPTYGKYGIMRKQFHCVSCCPHTSRNDGYGVYRAYIWQ